MPRERQAVPAEAFLTFDPPPARQPRPVRPDDHVRGHRLVLIRPDGYVYEQRAMSDPQLGPIAGVTDDDDRRHFVAVVSEYDWYRWALTRERPRVSWWPIVAQGKGGAPMVYVE